jgi:hypothetical protein
MQAFGFPFVASVQNGQGFGWGRAPNLSPAKITVERQTSHGWRRVAGTTTGRDGVFSVHFRASGNATYRASVAHGAKSLPYFSAPIPAQRTQTG